MKRLWCYVVMMLLLAACGGGGGSGGGSGKTGNLKITFADGSAKAAKTLALAANPEPQYVRVVVRQAGTSFK